MKNLIKEYNLNIDTNEKFIGIDECIYSTYDNKILLIGYKKNRSDYLKNEIDIIKTSVAYVIEFDLTEDEKMIIDFIKTEKEKNIFYKVNDELLNLLNNPYNDGYCKLNSYKHNFKSIEHYIELRKNEYTFIYNDALQCFLNQCIANHPIEVNDTYQDFINAQKLTFIQNWDFLLLSENKDIRELYKKYKKVSSQFFTNYINSID